MKRIQILALLILLIFSKTAFPQVLIEFNKITYNPDFFNNSGCSTYNRFGPNPVAVNGYNIRTVGGTLYTWNAPKDLSLYAWGNTETGQRTNAVVSVEYPFLANKTYLVEIYGMNDHNWNNWVVPKDHYNAVFWFKLENNPQILTTASNPCEESYSPVEKSVGRYSKLIADPAIAFEMKTYSVKFSPLENRSALKIFFDSSPVDPKVIIDNIFRLRNIKIVEMPYEEDSRYTAAYENVPRDLRIGEAYNISVEQPLVGGGGTVVRPIIISPNQWLSNSNGIGYHVNLSSIIPNLYVSNGVELSIHEPWNGVGRPTRGEYFPVPKNYKNTYFTFILENHDVIINTDNLPTTSVEFSLSYNP
ncbi:hypothetical protein GCM10022289_37030 [Pedobacter jeongneungensis]|uniref:Uncharacterized protein n=1 Tax=Pedobacter jeongneungensis TaxID=947309 RepID=A0ABP8BME1_9SPHI